MKIYAKGQMRIQNILASNKFLWLDHLVNIHRQNFHGCIKNYLVVFCALKDLHTEKHLGLNKKLQKLFPQMYCSYVQGRF